MRSRTNAVTSWAIITLIMAALCGWVAGLPGCKTLDPAEQQALGKAVACAACEQLDSPDARAACLLATRCVTPATPAPTAAPTVAPIATPSPTTPNPMLTLTPSPTATSSAPPPATPTAGGPPAACSTPPSIWMVNEGCQPNGTTDGKTYSCSGTMTYWYHIKGWTQPACGAPACGDWAARCAAVQQGCCFRAWDTPGIVVTLKACKKGSCQTGTWNPGDPPLRLANATFSSDGYSTHISAPRGTTITMTACPPSPVIAQGGIVVPVAGGAPGDASGCLTKTFTIEQGTAK